MTRRSRGGRDLPMGPPPDLLMSCAVLLRSA